MRPMATTFELQWSRRSAPVLVTGVLAGVSYVLPLVLLSGTAR